MTTPAEQGKYEPKKTTQQGTHGVTTTFRLPLPDDGAVLSITVEIKRDNGELEVALTM